MSKSVNAFLSNHYCYSNCCTWVSISINLFSYIWSTYSKPQGLYYHKYKEWIENIYIYKCQLSELEENTLRLYQPMRRNPYLSLCNCLSELRELFYKQMNDEYWQNQRFILIEKKTQKNYLNMIPFLQSNAWTPLSSSSVPNCLIFPYCEWWWVRIFQIVVLCSQSMCVKSASIVWAIC